MKVRHADMGNHIQKKILIIPETIKEERKLDDLSEIGIGEIYRDTKNKVEHLAIHLEELMHILRSHHNGF